jgi:hypothetical protein
VVVLQQGPNAPGLAIQRRMGQMVPFDFSIDQIGMGPLLRLPKRALLEELDKRGKRHGRFGEVRSHDGSLWRGRGEMPG